MYNLNRPSALTSVGGNSLVPVLWIWGLFRGQLECAEHDASFGLSRGAC